MSPSVAVMTATTNNPLLQDCVKSVDNQTYPCKHYLIADGVVDYIEFGSMISEYASDDRYVAYWPTKIKRPNMGAARIYAAAPSLINEDVICMLNEDDWFKPNHVESLVSLLEEGYDWAYSHRSIYDKEGKYLFDDQCESLGEAHDVFNIPGHRFVETCSIAMKTSAYLTCAQIFNIPSAVNDRNFYSFAKQHYPNFKGTHKPTMCFRLGGNAQSVTKQFFELGNAEMKKRYPNGFPWE
jgi:hypothetical protein